MTTTVIEVTNEQSTWRLALYGIGALIALFLVLVLIQPSEFRVSRSITIAAPAERVFPLVNNQKKWIDWSPLVKLDPTAIYSYEGPEEGVGAIARWRGNKEVGEGSSTILVSRPNEFLQFQLDFLEPMVTTHMTEFSFTSDGTQTTVVWTMAGKKTFMGKAMNLMVNCTKMMCTQFDQGLAALKATAEL